MKLSTLCFKESDIDSLISGDLSPKELATAESHLSGCEYCRSAVEQAIGPDEWWGDVRRSLSSHTDELFLTGEPQQSFPEEGVPNGKLLELLGPTDDPAMLGRIGSYEITGLLGQGGMGDVFKGFDRSLNRFVAIKMLLPHLATSGTARKRFAREGQAVAAVVDDHVMAIHCVDEWQGIPYLVMTYSRGVSLQKRLNDEGPFEVREILRIGMQAAKGLAAAHAQGIVHRDVKPANIFLDQNVERVQLMDFGLARAVDDASLTRSGTLAGTPQYMSPEQARAQSVDARSDLFSLGSVLYAMCTGRSPFRADSSYGVLRLITDEEPRPIREINPEIPEWLCKIITKLMDKQPDDRFQSAREIAVLLEGCLAHVQQPTIVSLPTSLEVQSSDRHVRSVTRSSLGAATMISVIGIGLLGMVMMGTPEPPDITGQWIGDGWGVVVLKLNQSDGYEGIFIESSPEKTGTMLLKWSKSEGRFNGSWQVGENRQGKISLRVADDEIDGGWTTSKGEDGQRPPRLANLRWVRFVPSREAEHVFGDDVIRSRLHSPGGIPDSETPSVLLIRTIAGERPSSSGEQRSAEFIDRSGNDRLQFSSGSKLRIGNHKVTILYVAQDFAIVECDGRWMRWSVDRDFADAIDLGQVPTLGQSKSDDLDSESELRITTSNEIGSEYPTLSNAKANKSAISLRLAYLEPHEGLDRRIVLGTEKAVYVARDVIATSDDVASAHVVDDPNGQPAVEITFKESSARRLGESTSRHRDKPIAIIVDGKLLCAPTIREAIADKAIISGQFSRAEAERIAKALNTHAQTPGTKKPVIEQPKTKS